MGYQGTCGVTSWPVGWLSVTPSFRPRSQAVPERHSGTQALAVIVWGVVVRTWVGRTAGSSRVLCPHHGLATSCPRAGKSQEGTDDLGPCGDVWETGDGGLDVSRLWDYTAGVLGCKDSITRGYHLEELLRSLVHCVL